MFIFDKGVKNKEGTKVFSITIVRKLNIQCKRMKFQFTFKKYLLTYLKISVMKRDRGKERFPIFWLTLQIVTTAGAN